MVFSLETSSSRYSSSVTIHRIGGTPRGAGDKNALSFHTGLPSTGMQKTRTVEVSEQGTHTVALEPGEDGSFAMLKSSVINFPYLYSVPMFWAKSPSALLVPRAVAAADGLTILK